VASPTLETNSRTTATGPLVVVGAQGFVGSALVQRLADGTAEPRSIDRGDDLSRAVRDAHAVVHVAGGYSPHRTETVHSVNVNSLRDTIASLDGSSVQRLVVLSCLGADPASPDHYLQAKGDAEQLARACAVPATILRSAHIFGDPAHPGPLAHACLAQDDRPVRVIGTGSQRWSPIYVGDVVDALVHAALNASTAYGTFDLAGPQVMTADTFVDLLNCRAVEKFHLHGGAPRLAGYAAHGLPPAMVEQLEADRWSVDTTAVDRFGLSLRSVTSVWAHRGG
jgi:uncharacterized protein YbjT (DUF2867 family)